MINEKKAELEKESAGNGQIKANPRSGAGAEGVAQRALAGRHGVGLAPVQC